MGYIDSNIYTNNIIIVRYYSLFLYQIWNVKICINMNYIIKLVVNARN